MSVGEGGRELAGAAHRQQLIGNFGHGAQYFCRNTTMTASKTADELDLIYFNNIIEPRFKIMSIINKIIYILSTRERGGPPAADDLSLDRPDP